MDNKKKIVIGVVILILLVSIGGVIYYTIYKDVTDRETFDGKKENLGNTPVDTTSNNFDFYITKPEHHNDIRFNDYYTIMDNGINRTIYLAGNLGEFYIKDQDSDITLKTYLSTTFQTLDDGIKSITDELELKETLRDGGTKIYKSKDKDITMIVCNTTKNDKNILIGDYSMEYVNGDCKN